MLPHAPRPSRAGDHKIRDLLQVRHLHLRWVLAALLLAVAPHVMHLPLWVDALALACGCWRLLAQQRGWALPPTALRTFMVLGSFAGVLLHYQTVNGVEAGSALLVVMASMKLTETRTRRDHVVLLFIGYFLVTAQFLYSQSIPLALLAIPTLIVLTGALLQVCHDGDLIPLPEMLRITGGLLGYALPVMLVLFVLFPRVPGPFWAIQGPKSSAVTGLSDKMSPGSISNLIESDTVAFRIRFEDEVPPQHELYWRGPVLTNFDGRTWTPMSSAIAPGPAPHDPRRGRQVHYEVTLEPHNKRWMFALDTVDPHSASRADAIVTQDYQVQSSHNLKEITRYYLSAFMGEPQRHITPQIRAATLNMPAQSNPRTRALVSTWRAQGLSDREVASAGLRMFREQAYFYTLRPPQLTSSQRIDEFLFESRRGFCEHFAAAFTVMMRMADIPARVVTGYQGGELNSSPILGGHVTVRQSDAHAWVEIWLEDNGWTRLDPTGFIPPERVEAEIADLRDDRVFGRGSGSLIGQVRLSFDALDNAWTEWVLGYGPKKQAGLMRSLGIKRPDAYKLVAMLAATLTVTAAMLFLLLNWRARRTRPDPVSHAYQRFCRKLAKAQIVRGPHEGPADFAARASQLRPDLGEQIERITALYLSLRYQGNDQDGVQQALRQQVTALRVTPHAVVAQS